MYQKYFPHESKTWTANGDEPISLHGMPDGDLTHFTLRVQGTVSNASGGTVAVTARDFASAVVSYAKLNTDFFVVDATPPVFYDLTECMDGKPFEKDSTSIANSASGTCTAVLTIAAVDLAHAFESDCAQPSQYFRNKTLNLKYGPATITTGVTLSSATVSLVSHFIPPTGKVPSKVEIKKLDWTGKEPRLDGVKGVLTHLIATSSQSSVSLTDYASFEVSSDTSGPIIPQVDSNVLISDWNRHIAKSEADELDGTYAFIPLVFQRRGYKLSKCPHGNEFRVKYTGNGTSIMLGYRAVQLVDKDARTVAAAKRGIDVSTKTKLVPATGSKAPPPTDPMKLGFLQSLLPSRLF